MWVWVYTHEISFNPCTIPRGRSWCSLWTKSKLETSRSLLVRDRARPQARYASSCSLEIKVGVMHRRDSPQKSLKKTDSWSWQTPAPKPPRAFHCTLNTCKDLLWPMRLALPTLHTYSHHSSALLAVSFPPRKYAQVLPTTGPLPTLFQCLVHSSFCLLHPPSHSWYLHIVPVPF